MVFHKTRRVVRPVVIPVVIPKYLLIIKNNLRTAGMSRERFLELPGE